VAGDNVAEDDDPFGRCEARVDEHGVERLHIAVDVCDGGYWHPKR
jgi:hypothetical protein